MVFTSFIEQHSTIWKMEKHTFLVYLDVIHVCRGYLLDNMHARRFRQRNNCIGTSAYVSAYILSNNRLYSMPLECPSYYPGHTQFPSRYHFITVSFSNNFDGKCSSITSSFPSVSICSLWRCYCICVYTSYPHDCREFPSN